MGLNKIQVKEAVESDTPRSHRVQAHVHSDKYLLYLLAVFGIGINLDIWENASVKRLANCYLGLHFMVFTSLATLVIVLAVPIEASTFSIRLVFYAMMVIMYVRNVLTGAITCYHNALGHGGFGNYYKLLDKSTKLMQELSPSYKPAEKTTVKKVMDVMGTVLVVISVVLMIQEPWGTKQFPIYHDSYQDKILEPSAFIAVKVLSSLISGTVVAVMILHSIYFVISIHHVTSLFKTFHQYLRSDTETKSITAVRRVHTTLSDLVSSCESNWSLILGIDLVTVTAMVLLGLYFIATASQKSEIPTILMVFLLLLGAEGVVQIGAADKLYNEYGKTHFLVTDADWVLKTEADSSSMDLFLHKLTQPHGLTVAGFFMLTRHIAIELVAGVMSYFLILIQFNSALSSTSGACCNCCTQANATLLNDISNQTTP